MKIERLMPEAAMLAELGRRLARIRKQQGFSQIRLAEEAGIGVATLRRIEAGRDGQMETWLKVMKSLRMTAAVDAFLPETYDSPMAEVLAGTKTARRTSSGHPKKAWGDVEK